MLQLLIRRNFRDGDRRKICEKAAGESRRWSGGGREKVNLIEYNTRKGFAGGEEGNERRGELLAAAEKAVFGLAGLMYSRRYTATNDDVSLPLRKRSSGLRAAPRSAFCQD